MFRKLPLAPDSAFTNIPISKMYRLTLPSVNSDPNNNKKGSDNIIRIEKIGKLAMKNKRVLDRTYLLSAL